MRVSLDGSADEPNVEVKVRIPSRLFQRTRAAAHRYDVTTGTVVRKALRAFLDGLDEPTDRAKTAEGKVVDLAAVGNAVKDAVSASSGWDQLTEALRERGLELLPKGGGLIVLDAESKAELCKASQAGFPYSALIKRFGKGFPGHPHEWLTERVLGREGSRDPLIEED